MKQTNNAIKFLMAQYRAIFKNANIAMVAAIAAAALAAGQAQAAEVNDWTKLDGKVTATTGSEIKVSGDGTTAKGVIVNDKGFALTITSGTNTISSKKKPIHFSVKDGLDSSITLNAGGDVDATKLIIGSATQNETATVTVGSFTNTKGTLEIQGSGAAADSSALNAKVIKIGDEKAADNDAVVTVKGYGSLNAKGEGSGEGLLIGKGAKITVEANGKIDATTITMTSGTLSNSGSVTAGTLNLSGGTLTAAEAVTASNELNITGGKVAATKAVSGKTIKVTGGEVDFGTGDAGALGSDTTDLITISGGTIDAKTAEGTIKGKTIKFEKGDIKASAHELTIDGGFEATGGTITVADNQTLTFKGNASIADEVTLTLNGKNKHTVKVVGTDAQNNGKLSVSEKQFKVLTADAASGSIVLTGASGSTAELKLTDATVDLGSAGLAILTDTDGKLGKKVTIDSGNKGVAKISGIGGTFDKANVLNAEDKKLSLDFETLTLGKDSFEIKSGAGVVARKTLTIGDGTKALTIAKGTLDLQGADGSSGNEVKASKITVGSTDKGTMSVTAGEWTVKSLEIASGSVNVINDAVLKITGDLTTKDSKNQLVATDTATIDASKAGTIKLLASGTKLDNASTLILDSADVFDGSGDVNKKAFADKAVEGSANSTINIVKDGELATISREKFEAFSKASGFKGLWGVKVDGLVPEGTTEMDINGQANNNIIAGLGTGYENVQAKVDGTKPIDNNYSAGSVALTSGTELTIGDGSMTLQNANAHDNDGMFVSKPGAASGDKATLAGVKFDGTSSLTLVGSGKIGAITAGAAGSGSVTFGAGEGKTGDVTVEGAIGSDTAAIGKLVTNGSNVTIASGDVFVQAIDLNGGSFNVAADKKLEVGAGTDLAATIDGNLTAGTLTFKANTTGSVDIASNAVVDLGTLTGATGIKINVGKDGVENGSATLLADKLVLKEATLKIDPAYDQPYASAIAMDLSGASGDTLDGLVEVGHNALFAVGFDTKAEVDAVLGTLVKNGSFADPTPSEPAPGPSTRSSVTAPDANAVVTPNAVVLNKGIKFDANGGIYVGTEAGKTATGNKLEVDAGSALVITDKVFTVDPATGKKTGFAISGSSATADIDQGAKLVLVGAFNGADNELEILSGFTSADAQLKKFDVSIGGSDLLEATWTTGGKLDVNLTQDKTKLASAFAGASTPVKQFMLDMLAGDKFAYSTEAGYQLINEFAMANNGVAADAAAHAATYAGAQQAAVASVTTMADAMFGRVGAVGVEAASIAATGSQANGGVWLTPMYKSVDSDGFNAQGASYGSDVDLSGVAFGADTVNGNMRFGAVFNIGSGDAEGKGNGNGLKDEFDYYGFGIYSAMGFGNFALVGDASMTVISHEVEGLGLRGKADTTAVTMGVTGQYTVATPAVDVTPHLGARFIRLNTDSYDLTSAKGVVGTTDFDVQNVFSVPLGVTLSKAFVAGGWSLAPSADLTIAFNTGDTDAKSTTRFTGINQNLDLTTEVLDEVQYGLTVGLGAQYGAFGTSFGINYTGSENTDAFGVNAQCRYMF